MSVGQSWLFSILIVFVSTTSLAGMWPLFTLCLQLGGIQYVIASTDEIYTETPDQYITAILGGDITLKCEINFPPAKELGKSVPYIIEWRKKGDIVPIYIFYSPYEPHESPAYEGRLSLINDGREEASLNIKSVRQNDEGWYECIVRFLDRHPENQANGSWIHLEVRAPPRFTKIPPDDIYLRTGDDISFLCEASGTPEPVITWNKDDQPLRSEGRVQVIASRVTIRTIQHPDTGRYTCIAKNNEGKISHTLKVTIAEGAVMIKPPDNLTKTEGDRADFVCEAQAKPNNITYHWFKDGTEIKYSSTLSSRTIVQRDGTLIVNPILAADGGKYTCEATNGIEEPTSAAAYLNVEYPARVKYTPTVQYLPYGLPGILNCYVESNPPLQFVTWTKDKRIFDQFATPGVTALSNGSLYFDKIRYSDAGKYTCTPYNLLGTGGTSSNMEAIVKEPPRFTIRPRHLYQILVNDKVMIPCAGDGTPKPTLTWRRANGELLPPGRTTIQGGNLTITALQKADYGYYECVISNDVATLVISSLLVVESTTPHAPTNVSVNTSSFAATIHWLPAYDGGFPQHYVIWYRELGASDKDWLTMRVEPKDITTFTIYNLLPETTYEIQVLSRNNIGDGMFSEKILATTKSADGLGTAFPTDSYGSTYIPTVVRTTGPKPGSPTNVIANMTKDGLQISWQPPSNKTIPVMYYIIEYRTDQQHWRQLTPPIIGSTSYLATNLQPGQKYEIRVVAFTLTAYSLPSETILYSVPGSSSRTALTAGVVGAVLFFLLSLSLALITIQICNKRRQIRKEKYEATRNGGHKPESESPVPLKKRRKKVKIVARAEYQA